MDATQRLHQLGDVLGMGFSLTAELPEDDLPSFEDLVPSHSMKSAINQYAEDRLQQQQQQQEAAAVPRGVPDAPAYWPSFEEMVPGHPLKSAINQLDEWQPQQQTTKPTDGPDAPRKFLTHDAGPRARTQGAFDNSRFKLGEPLDGDAEFCPWVVVQNTRRTMSAIPIDLTFYLYDPDKPSQKPHLLVPTAQLQSFLDFINEKLGIALAIPGGVNSNRFFMRFGEGGTPRPRYLRRVHGERDLEGGWPHGSISDVQAFWSAPQMCRNRWLEKLKSVSTAPRKDKEQEKGQRTAKRRADRKHMLDEAQTLLGLKQGHTVKGGKNGEDVVFICVDIEALERPPNPVSEVGIAVLDSKDIRNVPPGACGRNWWPLTRAHHLRTHEYAGLVNHRFVPGCPDYFDFGTSTFPTRAQLPHAIWSILNTYIHVSKDIVLVGHDTKQDIRYLASIGVDVIDMHSITRILDSQVMHQGWKDSDNGRGLEGVLADLGMASKNLHNAGNEAVFTLRAFIGMAIEEIRQQDAELKGEEYEPELWNA